MMEDRIENKISFRRINKKGVFWEFVTVSFFFHFFLFF